MADPLNRRGFLRRSVLATSTAVVGAGFEERALRAHQATAAPSPPPPAARRPLPTGRIGSLSVSRLICGGNLISGFAHSRDLIYVSALLKHYFTDAKVLDTLQLCESLGINTTILRLDQDTLRLLAAFRKERGGRLQWIAQVKLPDRDPTAEIEQAVDQGAAAVYVHGGVGDQCVTQGQIDLLAKALETIRKHRLPAGLAGHALQVPMTSEKRGLQPDFYMKTLNSKNYWSAGPVPRQDSVWEETPQDTIAFMAEVDRPWIAYKVLGAGAIHPSQGFQYAYENGADFICVGMFDFQVAEDVEIARNTLEKAQGRPRPWCA